MTDPFAPLGLGPMPFWAVVLGLFVVVMVRSHGTYWLARGAVAGAGRVAPHGRRGWREHVARLSEAPAARRAAAVVHRWGPVAVTVGYVTIGAQTAIMLAAGLARMPYLRFALASVPGAVAWALIWGTVGMSAFWAAIRLAAVSGWGLAAVLVVLALVATAVVRFRSATARAEHGTRVT
ncbi:DedA family protein [Cellulomonas hominis]